MLILSMLVETEQPINSRQQKIMFDEQIFTAIAEGDTRAIENLYLKTERVLYAYLLSLTKDHDFAVDLLQETYLKIMAAAHLYTPKGKPMAWIFSIAKNLFHDALRKKSRELSVGEMELLEHANLSYEMQPENKLVLTAALEELAEEERSIILLYAVSGMKHREIAKMLNLNLSTVLSKYHRGLKKLRTIIEKGGTSS